MVKISAFLLFCALFGAIAARRSFWRGKSFHEFYGDPTNRPWMKPLPVEEWLEQQLDPFDPTNNSTWKQRYFTNSDYFRPKDGPVFLMIGGEGTASPKWMVEGAWIKYAKEFGALCFQVEHRFYGKSHPTPSVTVDDLVYLSSETALADLTFFIMEMRRKYHLTTANRWIAFGGSYPGSLAAWLREKYPHLVHGAVSSSGPLVAIVDFWQYYNVVTEAISDCQDTVRDSIEQVELQLRTDLGRMAVKEKFHLCDPVDTTNDLDVANLFENLASIFAGVVQYNGTPRSKHNVDEFCTIMNNQTQGPALYRLALLNKIILDDEGSPCLDFKYEKMINDLRETSWDAGEVKNGTRQWIYQTCMEFGFYQTSNSPTLVFGDRFPVDFFTRQCTDIFGDHITSSSIDRSVYNSNVAYGALDTKATNVIYVHGTVDPWHTLGLTESNDVNVRTILIQGTAHCANMYEPREEDLPQLKAARIKIRDFIEELLQDKY
ncbi:putative serine protease F56F10.1 [Lutzomyia longipalpis]|uniref:putative serine protease F56F10.1 n=1 Tax=Lutzomyia longipalpis TaxID=7200 RepID=UPI0024843953|nr:putative serine protease F56F10.1 [Lutzomyia longipalpis]